MDVRAYSTFEVKSFDDGAGIVSGIASTPTTDRDGDIVEPKGALFKLPLPLLWQHDKNQPIGNVTHAVATAKGIEVTAQIAKGVSGEIDRAWRLIKAGLVRGFSIGFRAKDVAPLKEGRGYHIKTWEWFELSAVTIPANQEATILAVKEFDLTPVPPSGTSTAVPVMSPARSLAASSQPTKGIQMSTDTLRTMEAERQAKAARLGSILEKAKGEGRTLDIEEQKAFDEVQGEIGSIDATVQRLKAFETISAQDGNVVKVNGGGMPVRQSTGITHQKANWDFPGLGMARFVQALGVAKGNHFAAAEIAKQMWPEDGRLPMALKSAVAAGTTTDATWAGPLVNEWGAIAADFVAFLRPQTIIGKFGTNGIPALRRVPFRKPLVSQTTGGSANWVGEGKPKPLTKFDFGATNLDPLKVAAISVITMELARDSSPSASETVRDQLAEAVIARLDTDFIDPAKSASAGVSPASITNAVSAPNSNGNDEDGVRSDIQQIMATFLDADNPPTTGVWIMRPTVALALSLMTNGLGNRSFEGIGVNGGTFAGLPVITSNYVPSPTAGDYLILANARDIYLADEGGVSVDMSTEASLEMDSAPTDPVVAATVLISLWQQNLVAFRAERTMNWAKARATAVAMIDTVNYSAGT